MTTTTLLLQFIAGLLLYVMIDFAVAVTGRSASAEQYVIHDPLARGIVTGAWLFTISLVYTIGRTIGFEWEGLDTGVIVLGIIHWAVFAAGAGVAASAYAVYDSHHPGGKMTDQTKPTDVTADCCDDDEDLGEAQPTGVPDGDDEAAPADAPTSVTPDLDLG